MKLKLSKGRCTILYPSGSRTKMMFITARKRGPSCSTKLNVKVTARGRFYQFYPNHSSELDLMGDYGIGLQANVRALSPVDFNQLTNNQSLFSPDPKMQDETLAVKQNGDTSDQQALEDALKLKGQQPHQNGDDKVGLGQKNGTVDQNVVNSVANSLNQLGLSSGEPAASTSTPGGNFWSTATADDTFIQGFQTLNGAVTFQNFPPAPIFNNMAGLQQQQQQQQQHPGSGLNLQQQQAAQRRAITGQIGTQQAHNFPLQRGMQSQNVFLNNSKTYPTWSSAPQGSSWSQNIPNPWANMQGTRRTVPNLNPIGAPVKKAHSQQGQMNSAMLISPSKFRRSTSFPGQMQHTDMGNKPSLDFPGYENQREGGNMLGLQQVRGP